MEHFGIYLWAFGVFKAIWFILRPFGRFFRPLVHIFPSWYIVPKENLATLDSQGDQRAVFLHVFKPTRKVHA
jgi:hypothetical protein